MHNKTLLYDTFNARYLSFKQIAESFIPNTEFNQLHGNNSILLMGPRGCGKTTLLKMLTPAGIHYLKDDQDHEGELQFTAIYVPCDIQWKNQLDYLNSQLKSETQFNETVAQFLFATNVSIAMCKTFNSIIGFGNYTDQQKLQLESEVCRGLIKCWDIETPISPTFDDIELSLLKRVTKINILINQIIFQKPEQNIFGLLPDYAFSGFFDLVKIGSKVFEQKLQLDTSYKWALCFDELEIAPKFLQLKLISYLRSVDQKYIFKLTTTPLFNLENNIIEATQGNDFSTIKLWVFDETGLTKWREFCTKLILSRLQTKFNVFEKEAIEKIFEKFSLDEIIKEELNEIDPKIKAELGYNGKFKPGTGKDSAINFLFKYLAVVDESFKEFLIKRSVDPKDPFSKTENQAKSVFLKYKTDAVFRLVYKKRTRRTPPIHFGFPYIFDICDGNPRLVIGLIDEILLRSKYDSKETVRVAKNEQSQIIFETSNKYYNLLQNHPDSTIIVKDQEFNLADDVLKPIGAYMYRKIIQDSFSITSPSTFIIDDDVNQKIVKLLEVALYLGAIVYLDPIESLSNTGIVGKRFRISNFLTPYFKIPNRIVSQVNLSTILNIEQGRQQMKIDLM